MCMHTQTPEIITIIIIEHLPKHISLTVHQSLCRFTLIDMIINRHVGCNMLSYHVLIEIGITPLCTRVKYSNVCFISKLPLSGTHQLKSFSRFVTKAAITYRQCNALLLLTLTCFFNIYMCVCMCI